MRDEKLTCKAKGWGEKGKVGVIGERSVWELKGR